MLTDSDALPLVGHSALYVEVYNEDGSSAGFDLYEVGPVNNGDTSGFLSYDTLDPLMAGSAGASVGGSVSGSAGSASGAASGTASASVGSVALGASAVLAGVRREHFDTPAQLEARIARYDKVAVLTTTREQDLLIGAAAFSIGVDFGKYNLLTNNCSQFASRALAAGGVNTTTQPIPNIAQRWVEAFNPSLIRK